MKFKIEEYMFNEITYKVDWVKVYEKETDINSDIQDELEFFFELTKRLEVPFRMVVE